MKLNGVLHFIKTSIPLRLKKPVKLARVRIFERLGSLRYSRPALYEMEIKIQKYLDFDGGICIECGANDGYSQSNSYYLEKFRNWKCLLIEPVPYLFELCKKIRPNATVLNYALGDKDEGSLRIRSEDLISSVTSNDEEIDSFTRYDQISCRTISSILDEFGFTKVDLFSLDVEGYEISVLKGLDINRHDIRFILVETGNFAAVAEVLGVTYKLVDQFSHHDYLFRRANFETGMAEIE